MVSAQEYLQLERAANNKSAYFEGEIFAMAGASLAHNRIARNLNAYLFLQLRGSRCEVLGSETRIVVGDGQVFTYPDLVVVCGSAKLLVRSDDNLTNPTTIFEVLSPSTEAYDRGEKFEQYKKIATFTDYVLIAQDQPRVEHFERGADNDWLSMVYRDADATMTIDSITCALRLSEIYERVPYIFDCEYPD